MLVSSHSKRISDNTYALSGATDAPENLLFYNIKRPIGLTEMWKEECKWEAGS